MAWFISRPGPNRARRLYADRDSTQYPTGEKSEKTNRDECRDSFPFRPIQRIVDIVRWLGNKHDVGPFLILKLMIICYQNVGKKFMARILSTRVVVPSSASISLNDLNRNLNILQKAQLDRNKGPKISEARMLIAGIYYRDPNSRHSGLLPQLACSCENVPLPYYLTYGIWRE